MKPIYAASRTYHAEMWRGYRNSGFNIISSWIDEAGPGETADLGILWERIAKEIDVARGFVLYVEPGDFPLKGALIEAGYALARGIPFVLSAPNCVFDPPSFRPIGSWINHPGVERIDPLRVALKVAGRAGESPVKRKR